VPAFRRTPHVRYTVKRGPPCFPSAPMVSLRRQRLGADPVEAFVRIVAGGQSRHTRRAGGRAGVSELSAESAFALGMGALLDDLALVHASCSEKVVMTVA